MKEQDNKKLWHLSNFNIFKDLPKDVLMEISNKSIMCDVVKDSYIYFEDDPSDTIYFLKQGRVRVGTYSPDGREIIKIIMKAGEIFGELSLIGEKKRNDYALAIDDAIICKMPLADFEILLNKHGNLSLKITKLIGLRLKKIERRLESLVFKDARTRIIDFLKDQAEEVGEKIGYETLIRSKLTHQDIANLTATTRQTVNAVLNELRKDNLINFNRKQILIRDIEKLK